MKLVGIPGFANCDEQSQGMLQDEEAILLWCDSVTTASTSSVAPGAADWVVVGCIKYCVPVVAALLCGDIVGILLLCCKGLVVEKPTSCHQLLLSL